MTYRVTAYASWTDRDAGLPSHDATHPTRGAAMLERDALPYPIVDVLAEPRTCYPFGHTLPANAPDEPFPPCPACDRVTAQLATERRQGMTYVTDRCGQIGAMMRAPRAGVEPIVAFWSDPDGPMYQIGRRPTRAAAIAAIAACHECVD